MSEPKCRIWRLRLKRGGSCVCQTPDYHTKQEFKKLVPKLFIGVSVDAVQGMRYMRFEP